LGFRHEFKTIINESDVVTIRRRLEPVMARDANADQSGGYYIRSLYFENAQMSTFLDKLEGVAEREKYRLRLYNFQGMVYLERKEKKDSYVNKEVAALTPEELRQILENDSRALMTSEKQLLRRFELSRRLQLLKPVQLVDYYREAFVNPMGNVRVTLDQRLRAPFGMFPLTEQHLSAIDVLPDGQAILEVKYDAFIPKHIGQMLRLDGRRRQATSKFILCCAATQRIKENYTL